MEEAFIKGLKHVLSKKYSYVIVADRGFGHERFLNILEANNFKYLIRATPNLKVKQNDLVGIMEEVCLKDETGEINVVNWQKNINLHKCSNHSGSWYLFSNIDGLGHEDACNIYKDRFKIEKCFQDLKSSGFDIESSKIRKYANYKKLLAMVMVAHSLLVLLGHVIVVKIPAFLKNSVLMADVILAYFQLGKKHVSYFQRNN